MIRKLKDATWFAIHRNRRNRLLARFCRLCGNIHRAWEHPTYDVLVNGERDVLIHAGLPPGAILFDVGANVGDWTRMAKAACPDAFVHCFEMNPDTARILGENCGKLPGAKIHAVGLGEREHTARFFSYEGEQSVLSSLRANLYQCFDPIVREATIVTGDGFCRDHGIDQIGFLKIDAEGADFEILKGFSDMLAAKAIAVIQFEHEGGRHLRDFYDLLEPHGYRIGKLYGTYVDFRPHDISVERFLGPNYIAIPSTETGRIEKLRNGWG
jgi:FkbM family methyltransferase